MIDEKKLANAAMNDDELDQVAGGTVGETSDDSKFLYDHGLVDDWHGDFNTFFNWIPDSKEVDAGWSKAGITCVTKHSDVNQYFLNGKEITHDEAIAHVKANFSKIRDHNA